MSRNVIILTNENIKRALEVYPHILIDFFAPWCVHCVNMQNDYFNAADKMNTYQEKVPIAKIDCVTHKTACIEQQVHSYPTISLFSQGKKIPYAGRRGADDFVRWLRKKVINPVEIMKNKQEIDQAVARSKVYVVYYGAFNTPGYQIYKQIATSFESVELAALESTDTPKVVIYTFHSNPVEYTSSPFVYKELREFIDLYEHPLMMKFEGQGAIDVIFSERKPTIIFFRDDDNHKFVPTYEEIAQKNRGKKDHPLVFMYASKNQGEGNRFIRYLGIPVSENPIIAILQNSGGKITKFVLSKPINRENVDALIDMWRHEAAPAFFKSQKPPVVDLNPVKTIVRDTFEDLVIENDRFVLLAFMAPWCNWCKRLDPILTELARKLNYMEHLVIAKVDATQNEIENFPVHSFPTIYFFETEMKEEPKIYRADRTVAAMVEYIKKEMGELWQEPPKPLVITDL